MTVVCSVVEWQPNMKSNDSFSCVKCGRALTADEVALSKKLINRASTRFFCVDCLAEAFDVSSNALHEKIQYYKRIGCTLFPT